VLPLQFQAGQTVATLGLTGLESYDLLGTDTGLAPGCDISVRAISPDGKVSTFTVIVRIDTPEEVVAYRHGGILPFVLRQLVGASGTKE
jgi:aconitate hydratase